MTDELASLVIAQLLHLQSEDPKKSINMYINSPGELGCHRSKAGCAVVWGGVPVCVSPGHAAGGLVTAGLGIYDTVQYISAPVATWCVGQACSMGALLLAGGAAGMRSALPHSRIMVHQPSGHAGVSDLPSLCAHVGPRATAEHPSQGQATDIAIQAEEILKMKKMCNQIIAEHTGQPLDKIGELDGCVPCLPSL